MSATQKLRQSARHPEIGDLVAHRAGCHWGGIVTAVMLPSRDVALVCVQWAHKRLARLYLPHELEIISASRLGQE